MTNQHPYCWRESGRKELWRIDPVWQGEALVVVRGPVAVVLRGRLVVRSSGRVRADGARAPRDRSR